MRELINIIESNSVKQEIITQVNQTDDPTVLNRVLKVLRSGNFDERIKEVLDKDADASKFSDDIADIILRIDAPMEEKEAFLKKYPTGIVNISALLSGKLLSYLDIVDGNEFARKVFTTMVSNPALRPQGIGPGEVALAVLNPQISWSGRKSGGGDIVIGNESVELKTNLSEGGRWVNARHANLDMQLIVKAISEALKKSGVEPTGIMPARLNPTDWVETLRPAIDPKLLLNCAKVMANGLFPFVDNSRYQKAVISGSAEDIREAILDVGFANYKKYSGFDGILLMTHNIQSLQYFRDYASMRGLISAKTAYMYAPESEAMPQVSLSSVATTGVDAKAIQAANKVAAKAAKAVPAQPTVPVTPAAPTQATAPAQPAAPTQAAAPVTPEPDVPEEPVAPVATRTPEPRTTASTPRARRT